MAISQSELNAVGSRKEYPASIPDTPGEELTATEDDLEKSLESMMPVTPEDILEDMITTHRHKNAEYGASYLNHGKIMKALFPEGVVIATEDNFTDFGYINMLVAKFNRMASVFNKGRIHVDSIRDMGVYSALWESQVRNRNDINDLEE